MVAATLGLGDDVIDRHLPKREQRKVAVTEALLPSIEGVLVGAVVGQLAQVGTVDDIGEHTRLTLQAHPYQLGNLRDRSIPAH